jgi:hypothetical protein
MYCKGVKFVEVRYDISAEKWKKVGGGGEDVAYIKAQPTNHTRGNMENHRIYQAENTIPGQEHNQILLEGSIQPAEMRF